MPYCGMNCYIPSEFRDVFGWVERIDRDLYFTMALLNLQKYQIVSASRNHLTRAFLYCQAMNDDAAMNLIATVEELSFSDILHTEDK